MNELLVNPGNNLRDVFTRTLGSCAAPVTAKAAPACHHSINSNFTCGLPALLKAQISQYCEYRNILLAKDSSVVWAERSLCLQTL